MKKDLIQQKALRRSKVLLYAIGVWLILMLLAMLLYRGGNVVDVTSHSYNFVRNYLGDLGVTTTISGLNNFWGSNFAIIATILLGLGLLDFATNWRVLIKDRTHVSLIGPASAILLGTAGVLIIGTAITPWNTYFREHVLLYKFALSCLVGWGICYSYILWLAKSKRSLLLSSGIVCVLSLAYLLFVSFGPIFGGDVRVVWQTVVQKIVTVAIVANLAYQAYAIKKNLTR